MTGTRCTVALLCLVALAPGAPALGAQMRVVVRIRGYQTPISLDTLGTPSDLPSPPDRVYAASLAVFGDLGIPVNTKDPAKGIVAATRFTKMHSLAGSQLAQFYSCGSGMTGPHANEWRLEIAVAAMVDALPDGTARLRVASVSAGEDVTGSAKEPMPCNSTGQLELQLLELIRKKAARL
ncbi:MAG: hypothetical protein ACHQQ3_10220 [Gemmatimonadales bacterium]